MSGICQDSAGIVDCGIGGQASGGGGGPPTGPAGGDLGGTYPAPTTVVTSDLIPYIWVNQSAGNASAAPDGSVRNPFTTISNAIALALALGAVRVVIVVVPGFYAEDLNITVNVGLQQLWIVSAAKVSRNTVSSDDAPVVLDGSVIYENNQNASSFLEIDGLQIENGLVSTGTESRRISLRHTKVVGTGTVYAVELSASGAEVLQVLEDADLQSGASGALRFQAPGDVNTKQCIGRNGLIAGNVRMDVAARFQIISTPFFGNIDYNGTAGIGTIIDCGQRALSQTQEVPAAAQHRDLNSTLENAPPVPMFRVAGLLVHDLTFQNGRPAELFELLPNGTIQYGGAAALAQADRDLPALTTAADEDLALAAGITRRPSGAVWVLVNGLSVGVGDGAKDEACYFSADGGLTPRAAQDISRGDALYWVGSIAGYQLAAGNDQIDFLYGD